MQYAGAMGCHGEYVVLFLHSILHSFRRKGPASKGAGMRQGLAIWEIWDMTRGTGWREWFVRVKKVRGVWLQTAFSPMRSSNEVHALDTLYTLYNSAYYTSTQSASFVCLYGFVVDAMYYSCDKWAWLKSLLSMVRHSQTLRQQFPAARANSIGTRRSD